MVLLVIISSFAFHYYSYTKYLERPSDNWSSVVGELVKSASSDYRTTSIGLPGTQLNMQHFANPDFYIVLFNRFVGEILTPLGFLLLLLGVFVRTRENRGCVFYLWALMFFLTIIIFPAKYYFHNYYWMGFVPVAALFVGRGINFLYEARIFEKGYLKLKSVRLIAIVFILLMVAFYVAPYAVMHPSKRDIPKIGEIIDEMTEKSDVIVGHSSSNFMLLYYAHRKGWEFTPNWDDAVERLEWMRGQDAKYFVSVHFCDAAGKPDYHDLMKFPGFAEHLYDNYELIRSNKRFLMFDLREKFEGEQKLEIMFDKGMCPAYVDLNS